MGLIMHKVNSEVKESMIPSLRDNELIILEDYKKIIDKKFSMLFADIKNKDNTISEDIRKTIIVLEDIIQYLKKISVRMVGAKRTKELYNSWSDCITFTEEDGIMHIILPELFPKRYKKGCPQNNIDYVRDNYRGSFNKYFEKHDYKIEERAVLIYKSHYINESNMIDYDNFDYKILTDLITEHILIDDGPKRILSVSDYVLDSKEFSEIIIVPFSKAGEYVMPIFF